jgi:hypothetical protein
MAHDDHAYAADRADVDRAESEETTGPHQESDIVATALKQYERARQREQSNIDEAYEDLKFRKGDQWPEQQKAEREAEGRPCLTINRLPSFIRQVTGDMRQMRPTIRAVPVDGRGDLRTAEVISGMIRYIENRSTARHIYTKAGDSQVAAGIAHWEVTTEYANDSTFDQEIRIVGIADGISVLWDPDSILPTREDATFCFVPVDITRERFKERWPEAKAEDFGDAALRSAGWFGDDFVRVAAYWVKKPQTRLLALLPDGTIDDLTGREAAEIEQLKAGGVRIEERESSKICRYLITCAEVLETSEWPGRFIPVVPVVGEEVQIGREVYRHGVIRYARDPQRIYNYFRSAQTEVIALQPKAPFIATKDQVKNHLDQWQSANLKNWPVLYYDPDPKAAGTKPERMAPPISSQGITEGTLQAAEDMKAVIGIYDASLGARSNETSGKAILARQREGDVGTFVYIDNFSLAIQRTGQIVVDLIPHIYDTERMIRIVGEDGKVDLVEINKPVLVDGVERIAHDVTVGAYDVTIETGPSFTTRREEARDGMTEFIRAVPASAALIGDLYAKAQDWPNAQEIGERLEALLPPPLQALLAKQRGAANGQPSGPQPPDPAQMMQMQAQAQAMQVEQAKTAAELEKLQLENQGKALDLRRKELELALTERKTLGSEGPAVGPQLIGDAVATAMQPIAQRLDELAAIVLGPPPGRSAGRPPTMPEMRGPPPGPPREN